MPKHDFLMMRKEPRRDTLFSGFLSFQEKTVRAAADYVIIEV